MSTLEGRVALITGGGRGIGKTIARVLAQQGMLVGINDIDPALANTAVEEFTRESLRALALPGSVSIKREAYAMVDRIEAELGPLWLLVNNAGVFNAAPTADLSE